MAFAVGYLYVSQANTLEPTTHFNAVAIIALGCLIWLVFCQSKAIEGLIENASAVGLAMP